MDDEYIPDRKRNKAGKRAPCGFEAWDERKQKDVTRYPPVRCVQDCEHCGFNPEVAKKRIDRICGRQPS